MVMNPPTSDDMLTSTIRLVYWEERREFDLHFDITIIELINIPGNGRDHRDSTCVPFHSTTLCRCRYSISVDGDLCFLGRVSSPCFPYTGGRLCVVDLLCISATTQGEFFKLLDSPPITVLGN